MIKNGVVLLILCIPFKLSYSQCDDDKCYQDYKTQIEDERENIQKVFDDILEQYGDVDGLLKNLLDKLNETMVKADLSLDELERENNEMVYTNNLVNSTLLKLLNEVETVEDKISKFNETDRNWPQILADANDTANLIVSPIATYDEVKVYEDELEKWKHFLENLDNTYYDMDIMNIPHSISDDLDLIETLLSEEYDGKCFDKLHEDLKRLFAQLAELLDFDIYLKELADLEREAATNRNKFNDILDETNKILEEEKKLKQALYLANETLQLTDDIEELKNDIDELLKGNEKMFNENLDELKKAHERDLEELYKKYNTDDFEKLLGELEGLMKEIEELTGGEDVSIADLEKEIEEYSNDLDYYTCILEDCRYRQPAEATNTFNCVKKTPDTR